MGKIVAIGGGEISKPDSTAETTEIDKEIIKLTGKKSPRLLFIPTASSDSKEYYEAVNKHFGGSLGCQTDCLYLLKESPNVIEIKKKILGSDIIYVGGGNTAKMMRAWRKYGVDEALREAYQKGIVLSGLSAGSICWFKWGNSDSRRFKKPSAELVRVSGLGLINATHCPHYLHENDRRNTLKEMMKRTPGAAIALDDCCALEIIDETYRIIPSGKTMHAYKVYWKNHKYYEVPIPVSHEYRPVNELISV